MFKLIFLFLTPLTLALSNQESLSAWTNKTESKLVSKYDIIESEWFAQNCLSLARQMQMKKLNDCKIFDSEIINAYVFDNGHVYFSIAMMRQIKNRHQWAAILAHENAHLELHHYIKMLNKIKRPGIFFPKTKIRKMLKQHEGQADQWSKETLEKFGFDYSQINYFLLRVSKLKENNKNNNKHLKLAKRIKKTNATETIDEKFVNKIKLIKND